MTLRHDDDDQHHEFDLDGDDAAMPGPDFLVQFRRPMSEAEIDEAARALERAIAAWLADMEVMVPDEPAGIANLPPTSPSSTA